MSDQDPIPPIDLTGFASAKADFIFIKGFKLLFKFPVRRICPNTS